MSRLWRERVFAPKPYKPCRFGVGKKRPSAALRTVNLNFFSKCIRIYKGKVFTSVVSFLRDESQSEIKLNYSMHNSIVKKEIIDRYNM